MFQYKTKGNTSPQGKQKVYFTCHPDDFDRYFEKISNQILNFEDFKNCAVWFWDSEDPYGDIETELSGMKPFVIPVTAKLLETPNRTMDVDVPFALKRHIPVLPLMQENGLDELFNAKFGNLHYLDENAVDDTATPYKEKLKRYLSSVIVGDELAAKIRAAFDAYIFLSYRKKDRKHAQELMRLIHKNNFCRDIAIWYDEFLMPGEDFNAAIESALIDSKLFALVVTPNLVNEENYIRITEYPLAQKKEKKILPVELVRTDREKLSEMYPEIPDCVDAENSIQLSESLLDSLQSIAKAENNSDLQHNFFIGLAYLNGIDVETDIERGKTLITSCAEAGLPEAMKKLSEMYYNGEGVLMDIEKAEKWNHAYLARLETLYAAERSYTAAKQLFWERDTFANRFSESAFYVNIDELATIKPATIINGAKYQFEKNIEFAEGLVKENWTQYSYYYAVSYLSAGRFYNHYGLHPKGEEYLHKAIQVISKTAEKVANLEHIYVDVGAMGCFCLAEYYDALCHPDEKSGLVVRPSGKYIPTPRGYNSELTTEYIPEKQYRGDSDLAKKADILYQKAISLYTNLCDHDPERYAVLLVSCCVRAEKFYEDFKKYERAKECRKPVEKLVGKCIAAPANVLESTVGFLERSCDLAISFWGLNNGKQEFFEKTLAEAWEKLAKFNPQKYGDKLISTCYKFHKHYSRIICNTSDKYSKMAECYRQRMIGFWEVWEELAVKNPGYYSKSLVNSYYLLAEVSREWREYCHQRAIRIWKILSDTYGDCYKAELAESYCKWGDVFIQKLHRPIKTEAELNFCYSKAEECYKQAQAIYLQLSEAGSAKYDAVLKEIDTILEDCRGKRYEWITSWESIARVVPVDSLV